MKFHVRVQPSSPRQEVCGWDGDTLRVRLTAPATDGQANRALAALLSKQFDVPKTRVLIVHGHASHTKLVDLPGIDRAHVEARLAPAMRSKPARG